jgi:hypothetical protein
LTSTRRGMATASWLCLHFSRVILERQPNCELVICHTHAARQNARVTRLRRRGVSRPIIRFRAADLRGLAAEFERKDPSATSSATESGGSSEVALHPIRRRDGAGLDLYATLHHEGASRGNSEHFTLRLAPCGRDFMRVTERQVAIYHCRPWLRSARVARCRSIGRSHCARTLAC